MHKKQVIYISGPMSGKFENNANRFREAKLYLEDGTYGEQYQSYSVVIPHDLWNADNKPTYLNDTGIWLTAMWEMLRYITDNQPALFMLQNWQESSGATIEHIWARKIGLKIYYQPEPKIHSYSIGAGTPLEAF